MIQVQALNNYIYVRVIKFVLSVFLLRAHLLIEVTGIHSKVGYNKGMFGYARGLTPHMKYCC